MGDAPPRPDSGWSREIETVPSAVVVPPATARMRKPAGVLRADGTWCAAASVWRFDRPMTLRPDMPGEPDRHIRGRWLWGGALFDHFGHFLVESLSRFWALDKVPDVRGVIFIPQRPRRGKQLLEFQKDILELFGRPVPVRIVHRPTRVAELVVPGQGMGLAKSDAGPEDRCITAGTPEMHRCFRDRFAAGIAPEGPGRLFVSRAALEPKIGGLLGEDRIGRLLASAGYEVFHPEKADIRTQIARYRAAEKIILTDGSAAHLFAYVARPDQDVAYIARRSYWSEGPIRHVTGFSGRRPLVLDTLRGEWIPTAESGLKRMSLGQPDLRRLSAELSAAGFLDAGTTWPDLDDTAVSDILRRHDLHREFRFKPASTA